MKVYLGMKFIPKNICVWRNPLHTCYGYIKGCTSEGDNHFQIRTHICRCDNKNWWFFFFFFEGGLNWRISQNITGLIPRWFLSILTMIQDSSMCLWSTEFNRSSTSSRQWKYMESEQNPADHSSQTQCERICKVHLVHWTEFPMAKGSP